MRNIILLSLLLGSYPLYALDVAITGQVITNPCEVDTSTVTKLVDFGQMHTANFQAAGYGDDWHKFDLLVKNCPSELTSATVLFTGQIDPENSGLYKNMGTATHVSVQLASRDHNITYSTGTSMVAIIDSNRQGAFPLSARTFTTTGNVIGGTVNTVVQLEFTYQ
ncbi:fimbrial protein [Buttiauxella sp. B2]|uniref:fimbrial protein n=1 Tax=Buttiauxella sp. B2 TaxID=2587812 RepID=UPI001672D9BB|nr:fimbrial protein [Buttiauxella sp. B2]